jgi:hypothetical protein
VRCWSGSRGTTARLRRSWSRRRRRPTASACRTARCSASSRLPPSRSVTPAIAAG